MPIDLFVWRKEFEDQAIPAWPCPRCGSNTLGLVPKSMHEQQSAESKGEMRRLYFHPELDFGVFCCVLKCERNACGESCAMSGHYRRSEITFPDGDMGAVTHLRPTSVVPPLPVIRLPRGCPDRLRDEACRAFGLYWADPAACLNSVRQAVEVLLTYLRVPEKHRIVKRGTGSVKVARLSLHQRIEQLRARRPRLGTLCDRLVAVKHLGNAGSHAGDVTDADALDGFDILEAALAAAFPGFDDLERKVKEINRRKGPRRRGV